MSPTGSCFELLFHSCWCYLVGDMEPLDIRVGGAVGCLKQATREGPPKGDSQLQVSASSCFLVLCDVNALSTSFHHMGLFHAFPTMVG